MKPLATDTSLEAERVQLQILRGMDPPQRFAIASSLIDFAIDSTWDVIRRTHAPAPNEELQTFAALHYGKTLAHISANTTNQQPTPQERHRMQDRLVHTMLPVAEALEQLTIPYVIGGSVASILHGMPRTTMDIDLVADYASHHVAPLVALLQPTCYIDQRMIFEAISHRSSFNVITYSTGMKVDIFLPKQRPFDQMLIKRAYAARIHPDFRPFPIITPEDTVLAKLEWYRLGNEISERQWYDIQGILKLQANALDMDYLRQWAATLQVTDLLVQALEDAGL